MEQKLIYWFRRDLRLEDNQALYVALQSEIKVQCIFIFDEQILSELEKKDARVSFIYEELLKLHETLVSYGSSLQIFHGKVEAIHKKLLQEENVVGLYFNRDYEPYALRRDREVSELWKTQGKEVHSSRDQVIFEPEEILKQDGRPYTVYTPYKNKWLTQFEGVQAQKMDKDLTSNFAKSNYHFPSLASIGFVLSDIKVRPFNLAIVEHYAANRDLPFKDETSYLSPHLRFGTISVRQVIDQLKSSDEVFLSELIWREFFMQILYHYPDVVHHNFKRKYDAVPWRNNEQEFEKWCQGQTGYPMVDAGMRQLNETGYMHNRVRMITAGFLCKHLLIDWRWGEAYFAKHLLDYDLSANNGNWQWAAGTGCDAAPYFRIFNPIEQLKKFDPKMDYVKKWIPELLSGHYSPPIVEHKSARKRCLATYKSALQI